MGDHAWGDPKVRSVEGKDALDVGKHKAVVVVGQLRRQRGCCTRILRGFRIRPAGREFQREGGNKGIGSDPEEGVGGNNATHGMANQDSSNEGVDGGRRGGGRDLNINHNILKPKWEKNVALMRANGISWGESSHNTPFNKSRNTLRQISSCLEFGINYRLD